MNEWRQFVDENEMIYFWSESIVLGIVDDIMDHKMSDIQLSVKPKNSKKDVDETLNEIEMALQDLLNQKLEFQRKCKAFIRIKQRESYSMSDIDNLKQCKLEMALSAYLQNKQKRKNQIATIVRDITNIYKYYQSC